MIPLEQGSVFRQHLQLTVHHALLCLNPFGTGQCLSTIFVRVLSVCKKSQSLWNRAVSFDEFGVQLRHISKVSIPLEQGSVFRHITQATNVQDFLSQSLWNRAVSSDFLLSGESNFHCSLNPFGTGQCLPTNHAYK